MKSFIEWLKTESPLSHYSAHFLPSFDDKRAQDIEDERREKISKSPPFTGQKYVQGYFSHRDKDILSHPSSKIKLEKVLNRHGYNINIIIKEFTSETSEFSATMEIEDYLNNNNIPRANHITFVKKGSTGDYLSSWMLLHTMGHAVADYYKKASSTNLEVEIAKCLANTDFDLGIRQELLDLSVNLPIVVLREELFRLQDLFVFKSMKETKGSILQYSEIVHELVAEYLWNGRIRVKKSEQKEIANCVENKVKKALDICVGEIIFDWF